MCSSGLDAVVFLLDRDGGGFMVLVRLCFSMRLARS